MENKFEYIEDIIAKFLAGEASHEEIALLEEWRNLNDENAREFSQLEKVFNMTSSIGEIMSIDTDSAWLKVKQSLQHSSPEGKVIQFKNRNQFSSFLRIAAVLLLIAGLSIAVFFLIGKHEGQLANINTTDSSKDFTLPDGSTLTLNRNSSINYSINSFSKKRLIKLRGEAFFEVKHDSLSPFIVEIGDLKIQDIGTSFNVNAKPGSNTVIISVVEGEVQITMASGNSVFLTAGEEAVYNIESRNLETNKHIDVNIAAYKDKIFIFDNAELGTLVNIMNDIYSIKLFLDNEELKHCRITVSFNNEKIEDIADIIAETLGLTIKKEEDKIIFGGNGCK